MTVTAGRTASMAVRNGRLLLKGNEKTAALDVVSDDVSGPMSVPEPSFGPCAKTRVTCTLITPAGELIVGENHCANPQPVCPRAPGENYTKCRTICGQVGHAEVVAVEKAGDKARGAAAFLQGHSYACMDCQHKLFAAGVVTLTVGPPRSSSSPSVGSYTHAVSWLDDLVNQRLERPAAIELGLFFDRIRAAERARCRAALVDLKTTPPWNHRTAKHALDAAIAILKAFT